METRPNKPNDLRDIELKEQTNHDFSKIIKYGQGYLSLDHDPVNAYNLLSTIKSDTQNIILITRNDTDIFKKHLNSETSTILLGSHNAFGKTITNNLLEIENEVKKFLKNNMHGIVFLERIDYLISIHGFYDFLNFLYKLNDIINTEQGLLILYSYPDILSKEQTSLLSLELSNLPKPEVYKDIALEKDLFEILELLSNAENKISFKTICKKFAITKATARKRIQNLYNKKLITIKKDGRSKILELTKEGRMVV